jgi:hypothetical protein
LDEPLNVGEFDQIRERVLTRLAGGNIQDVPPGRANAWLRPAFIYAGLLGIIILASVIRFAGINPDPANSNKANKTEPPLSIRPERDADSSGSVEYFPTQSQFTTAAGTRIVWVFNDRLDLDPHN